MIKHLNIWRLSLPFLVLVADSHKTKCCYKFQMLDGVVDQPTKNEETFRRSFNLWVLSFIIRRFSAFIRLFFFSACSVQSLL